MGPLLPDFKRSLMLKTKLSLIFKCWQHIHILFHQWALIPSQLLFAASAMGSELLNRSKARGREGGGDIVFSRVLGCRPYSVCKVLGYLGSCLWVSWESMALAVLTGFQEAGPPAALASLGNLGPVWVLLVPEGPPRICGHACDSRVPGKGSCNPRAPRGVVLCGPCPFLEYQGGGGVVGSPGI